MNFIVLAVALFTTTLAPLSAHAQYYEAPWSTPGEYEYQYTTAEGIIPPSYYDYGFTSVNTNGYAMDEYLQTYPTYTQYGSAYDTYAYGAGSSMFEDAYTAPTYAQYHPHVQQYSHAPRHMYSANTAASFQSTGTPYVAPYDSVAAAKVLNCTPGEVLWRTDETGALAYYVDGSSAQSSTTTNHVRPSCRMYPKATGTGTVILEWVTNNATTAFIDSGIGHVSLGTGGRMVTPVQSTVYTMTVVNERGASAQCAANVVVKGTAPVGAQTLTVNQNGVQQFYDAQGNPIAGAPQTGATSQQNSGTNQGSVNNGAPITNGATSNGQPAPVTYDANGNPIQAITSGVSQVGGNVMDKITGALSGGTSIWERIRTVSMIALGIFLVLAVVVLVMKKMFGGGGEGGH